MRAGGPAPSPRAAPLVLALLAAAGAPAAARAEAGSPAAPTALDAGERDPAVLLVVSPKDGAPTVRAADLLHALDPVLRARTDLALRSPEQAGVDLRELDGCEGGLRLSCWTRALRPETGGHPERAGARPGGEGVPRFLVVLAVYPAPPEGELVSAMLVDLDRAAATLLEAAGDEERSENRIFEGATTARTKPVRAREPNALEGFFGRLAEEDWRPRLLEAGRWEPFGRVEVEAAEAPLALELDGRAVGVTAAPRTTLAGVRPGERTLGFARPAGSAGGAARTELRVRVERGRAARVTPALERAAAPAPDRWVRPTTVAAGAALGLAGLALAGVAALAPADGQLLWVCRGGECAAAAPSFRATCELGGGDRACLTEGGVLLAPLGWSLAAVGATWTIGALVEDHDGVPWRSLALGVLLGAAGYGLGAALDGGAR